LILHYLFRRLFLLSFVFLAMTVFTFSLSYMFPGDPLSNFSGLMYYASEDTAQLRAQYGLDANYVTQYVMYIERLVAGQWGLSFSSGQPVLPELITLMPATLELAAYALLVSLTLGIPLGLLSAVRHDDWLGKMISNVAVVGYSVPMFWLALLLIMLYSLTLGWLPTSGRLGVLYEIPPQTGFMLIDILLADVPYQTAALQDAFYHLLLPTLVLATYPTTVMIRFTRDSMLSVLEQNYIKTARAKGLSRSQVLYRHGLRNALLPVTRQVGLQFSSLITLAMLTEVIFSWPGAGSWLIDSIYQRNFPAIQAGVLFVSSLVVVVNMFTEIMHTLLNPLARKG
jgi:ABC-type antimicrobial peptide transport system permease subunit